MVRASLVGLGVTLTLLGTLAGCGDEDDASLVDAGASDATPGTLDAESDATRDAGPPSSPDCDPLDPTSCALPWPSNLYLAPDPTTATGVRLAFGPQSLPSARDVHIAPERFEGLDGYGLGVPVIVGFGELDYSLLPGEWGGGIARSIEPSSPTRLFRVTPEGLEPVPHFVEPDRNEPNPEARVTYLRPGVILEPSTRYVVAFRGLRRPDGSAVAASSAFAALRDDVSPLDPTLAPRRARFEEIFTLLEGAGVPRDELVLAWDFVTGSEAALHERLDRAVELALIDAPEGGTLTVDEVTERVPEDDGSGRPVNRFVRYSIRATLSRPTVVRRPEGSAGWEVVLDAEGRVALAPERGATRMLIQVPHRAITGESLGVIVYGHGLLGSEEEIFADHLEQLAEQLGFIVIAVPMVGMSNDDLDGLLEALGDLNRFTVISDGLHQGILDHHLAVRAARTQLERTLRTVDDQITIDESLVEFFGASQGGIFGQTILATSPELRHGVLAVPGNNYVTMLQRSVNFANFDTLLRGSYRRGPDRAVAVAAVQLLWDRTDPVSYVRRMLGVGAAAGAPERRGLLLLSKGDYQVPVVTNEIASRTYPDLLPLLADYDVERTPDLLTETPYPREGSGLVLFDFGNPWPSDRGNLPPMDGLRDPHPRIAEVLEAGALLDTFLREGRIVDVCGGDGCTPR